MTPEERVITVLTVLLLLSAPLVFAEQGVTGARAPEAVAAGVATDSSGGGRNLALGRACTFSPDPSYAGCRDEGDSFDLTDGIYNQCRWTLKGTVGWVVQNDKLSTVFIDLGAAGPIGKITFDTSGDLRTSVGLPAAVLAFVSVDGENYRFLGDVVTEHVPQNEFVNHRFVLDGLKGWGRHVRFVIFPTANCVFADEIEVIEGTHSHEQAAYIDNTPIPAAEVERYAWDMKDRVDQKKAGALPEDVTDRMREAMRQTPPPVEISSGHVIPSEGYCDQPYVVKLADGTWLCTMTTGKGEEGHTGQHIVSCRSADRGKTWSKLVDIEPANGPEASWVMPYLTKYGRVYVFYTYNAANMREAKKRNGHLTGRVDTLGEYAFKYSDDGGLTWSKKRWYIPVRQTAIDRNNPYQGKVRYFWGVGKPIRHKDAMYLGFAKVDIIKGFLDVTESYFLRCANVDTERDPAKLRWATLPEGEKGLTSPEGPIAEEANLTNLSDGGLFCTYRTVAGHPCHAYSRDDGKTWTAPAFMTYGPGGKLVDHPRAANFVRKLTEGPYAGRFIYWFHNHGGKDYHFRNPAYLLGGIEIDGPDGKMIRWGNPVAVLYSRNLAARISYPDFIWDDGLYITETQKSVARVHRIPDALLRCLWEDVDRDRGRS